MDKLKITIFADPVCTWCWGTAPIARAIEYRYGDKVSINYVMTGMIDDIRTFSERRLQIGGDDIALSNRNMIKAWVDASKIHGMPVQEKGFSLFDEEHRSTIPQCLAYIAAEQCVAQNVDAKRKAHHYLRVLQQATAAEAMHTCKISTLVDLAATVGIEHEAMLRAIGSEKTRETFEKGRRLAEHYGVKKTPTFLLEYRQKELIVEGYVSFESLQENITHITSGNILPGCGENNNVEYLKPKQENVARYLECYGSAYPVDIAVAFGLERHCGHTALNIESYEHLPNIIERLFIDEKIAMTPLANSFKLYTLKEGRTATQYREKEFAGTM